MNTLKIEIPNGFEIDNFDIKTGEIKFKETPKDIKERIKTFDDVLNYHNETIAGFYEKYEDLEPDEIAYVKVKLIVKALNEGWTPDWENGKFDKYFPLFDMGSPSGVGFSYIGCGDWFSYSFVGSRLCFKSSELAKYAGKQFTEIYKDFFTLK